MYYGVSLFFIALGAILRYAVTDTIEEVDLYALGGILMVVGVIGLVVSFIQTAMLRRRRRVVVEERPLVRQY